jgi:hypothetical protein
MEAFHEGFNDSKYRPAPLLKEWSPPATWAARAVAASSPTKEHAMPPVNAAMRCANFEERRDRAMALFAEKGFGQVSMRELAAHGLTAGSLYHHFPSKQDLLYDLIEELYEELQATLDQAAGPWPRASRCWPA